ncbi:MAG: glycosyltransferase family 1 protein [Candidatus Parcubacteria bacterium]|nr:glycosyltransferase family 1 protein [Burkholderiales bacterium]
MRILCAFGRHAYGDASRGESYEHANMLPALQALGHETQLFDSFGRAQHRDFAALNRAFLEKVETFRPQAVFCVLMHYELWTETLDMARAGAALLNWGTDDSWKYGQFSRFIAPHVDLYVTTSRQALGKARAAGLEGMFLSQWAASSHALAAPLRASECRHRVTFVGAAYGNRRRWITELAARGIEVECFGHGWPNGAVTAVDVARIARESAISLGFGDSGLQWEGLLPYRSRQIKARTFEIPGAGGFLLTEGAEELERYYVPGKEIEVFASAADAAVKIRRYLSDPELRNRVAIAGHERTAREHTYEQRFAPLLAQAEEIAGNRSAGWRADRAVLNRLVEEHVPGAGLSMLRSLLVSLAVLLFGSRRGPRAARRLLFELSWRAAGARTYSHRGWPGRLFYRES